MSGTIEDEHQIDHCSESVSNLSLYEHSNHELAPDNYFGENARNNFFEHYKHLTNQSNITLRELDDPNDHSSSDDELEVHSIHSSPNKLPKLHNNYFQARQSPLPNKYTLSPLKEDELKPPRRGSRGSGHSRNVSPLPSARQAPLPSSRGNSLPSSVVSSRNNSRSNSRSSTPDRHLEILQSLPDLPRSRPSSRAGELLPLPLPSRGTGNSQYPDSDQDDLHSVHSDTSRSEPRSNAFAPVRLSPVKINPIIPRPKDRTSKPQRQHGEGDSEYSETDGNHGNEEDDEDFQRDLESISELAHPHKRSPRTRYIRNCIKEQINPRPSLLVRKNITKTLDLQHRGMNDDFAKSFAASLRELPSLESINIADNRLSDSGLHAIVSEIIHLSTLYELNLSQNKIGKKAANALYTYLSQSNCSLHRLILDSADIDDEECGRLFTSIQNNPSSKLMELIVSHNEIGKKESLKKSRHSSTSNTASHSSGSNSNQEEIGPHAIAVLLASPHCQLAKLDLTWNMIRMEGAMHLAQSLALNSSLVSLDLSYNSLGTSGSIAFGSALISNHTLEYVNLSHNSIDAIGCLTVVAGVIENRSIKRLILDGNAIGDQGIKAILLLPVLSIRGVDISVEKCNTTIKDSHCFFDFDHIDTEYLLNLSNPFHRAIAIILVHFIAGHQRFNFTKFEYSDPPKPHKEGVTNNKNKGSASKTTAADNNNHSTTSSNSALSVLTNSSLHDNLLKYSDLVSQLPSLLKLKPVDLQFAISQDCIHYFSDKERQLLQSLEQIREAASDIRKAANFFSEIDKDQSGTVDKSELQLLLQKLGIEISESRLTSLIKRYDVNDSDSLDFMEFLALVKHQKVEAEHRIREFMDRPILIETSTTPTSNSTKAYLPPDSGYLNLTVTNDLTRTGFSRVLTTCDCDHILSVVKSLGGVNFLEVVLSCLDHSLLRMNEALTLIDLLLVESRDKVEIVRRVLMQLYDSNEAILFLHSVFHHNRQEVMRLKWEYGMALRPLLGNPNGYYLLDLSKEIDRKCLLKLVKISQREKHKRIQAAIDLMGGDETRYYHIGDLSQSGDYSCFRNELFNQEVIPLTDHFVAHLPNSGILQFDFSSTHRPSGDQVLHAKSDTYIVHLLVKHHLIHPSEVDTALQKLSHYRTIAEKSLGASGKTIYECPASRATAIASHMADFYQHLTVRAEQYTDARNKVCKPVQAVVAASPSHQNHHSSPNHHRRASTTTPTNHESSLPNNNNSTGGGGGGSSTSSGRDLFERDSYPMPSMLSHFYHNNSMTSSTTNISHNSNSSSNRVMSGNHATSNDSHTNTSTRPPSQSSNSSSQQQQHYLVPSVLSSKSNTNSQSHSASRDKEVDFSLDSNDSWDELCVSASRDEFELALHLQPSRALPTSSSNNHHHNSSSDKLGIAEQSRRDSPITAPIASPTSPSQPKPLTEKSSFHLLKREHSHVHVQHEKNNSEDLLRSALSPSSRHSLSNGNDDKLGLNDSEYQEALQLELEILEKARKMKANNTATVQKQHQKLTLAQHQLMSQISIHMGANNTSNNNSISPVHPLPTSPSVKDDFLSKFKTLLDSIHVQDATKAHRLVDLLEDIFCRTWIYARHLALMLECFVQFGYYKQTAFFGTYRVELVVSIFTRIIDIHNFELVLQVLSPFEAACVICRLGYLLVFNPCKPEGAWELDLARREERLIVKMLCMLGIYEPGNNFVNPSFRWSRDVEAVPGWDLVQPWLTEEGLPTKGILQVTYYSGEGKGLHGCKPFVSFRKALLQFVLIREEEMVEEEFAAIALKTASQTATARKAVFLKHKELWESYFVPLPPLPQQAKKANKKATKK